MPYKSKEDMKEQQRRYYQDNKAKYLEAYNKQYREKRVFLKSRRNVLIENKPNYPIKGECSLCDGQYKLYYHHWTDEHPEWGMWICYTCHILAEKVERGLDESYKELKRQVSSE